MEKLLITIFPSFVHSKFLEELARKMFALDNTNDALKQEIETREGKNVNKELGLTT